MFEIMDTQTQEAVIKVIGIGGCGGNAVDHMIQNGVQGVEFICANTDAQALKRNQARTLLQLGSAITKGLGAGADPDIGRNAALEDRDRIAELIEGADMLFITAGMGGGTGTGRGAGNCAGGQGNGYSYRSGGNQTFLLRGAPYQGGGRPEWKHCHNMSIR